MADDKSERGLPASFDPRTGEVHGSGWGAGGGGIAGVVYDLYSTGGGGWEPPHGPRGADEAVDRDIDPDEGV